MQQYAKTPYGKELIQNLEPAPNISIAQQMQDAVTRARKLLDEKIIFEPEDVPNCRAALKQAGNPGAMLNAQALANIVKLIISAEYLSDFVKPFPELLPQEYRDYTLPLPLKTNIQQAITDAGRLKPDASEKLQELHQEIQELRQTALSKIQAHIRDESLKSFLDDDHQTHWHGDHLVLLVKTQCLDKVKGVIKGSQSSGKIQLVEPMVLLAENNQLEKHSQAVYAEQQAILRQLSAEVSKNTICLLQIIDAITWVDIVFSSAQLSAMMNASPPVLHNKSRIKLNKVYHPVLLIQFMQGKLSMPIPVSVELSESTPFMLITGPNTGGKTVVLKTVGLLQIMAQCGLHIPAEGECEMGWFDTVMVDMGDRQSMYHQLSTFAGHIEVMKKLLDHCKPGALFLLDELGTGTDPNEGAAIAMSMIDTLVEQGALGIVNTHLPQLKPYAKTNAKVQQAAMLFDEESLKPNYQLVTGISGQSLGLIIAEKNGLPMEVVKLAKKYHETIERGG